MKNVLLIGSLIGLQFPPTTNFRKCEQYNIITQTGNATTGKFNRLAMVWCGLYHYRQGYLSFHRSKCCRPPRMQASESASNFNLCDDNFIVDNQSTDHAKPLSICFLPK